jgi:hypothetical protein
MNPVWYAIGLSQGLNTSRSLYDCSEIGPIGGSVIIIGLLVMLIFVIMFFRFMRTW